MARLETISVLFPSFSFKLLSGISNTRRILNIKPRSCVLRCLDAQCGLCGTGGLCGSGSGGGVEECTADTKPCELQRGLVCRHASDAASSTNFCMLDTVVIEEDYPKQ